MDGRRSTVEHSADTAASPLYHVIAATTETVYELDVRAPDAPSALVFADEDIRGQLPHARMTQAHVRLLDSGYRR